MISGTELLLEPSGGRALLLEKSEIPSKRSEMSAPPEIIQVFPTEPDETEADKTKVRAVENKHETSSRTCGAVCVPRDETIVFRKKYGGGGTKLIRKIFEFDFIFWVLFIF